MKISHVTTRVLSTPADNPLVVGLPAPSETREFVTLELGTDQGLIGLGLTFFGAALTPALKAAVDGLARLTVGEDPTQVEAIAAKLRRAAGSSGPGGIFTLALSAIDMACWDLKGKAVSQSVKTLLGGLRDRVPTYASGALMRPLPPDYLAMAGPRLAGMGFRQMKMQCGSEPSVAASVERVRVMREAVGPDIDLMCDINQLWSVQHAIEVGRLVERYQLYWLKVAGMAEAFNLPVVSHLIPEVHVHLVAAIPNGLTIEYMPRTLRLWEETPAIEDGQLVVPKKPGLGLAFDQAALERYQVG